MVLRLVTDIARARTLAISLAWPTVLLGLFFVLPFLLMVMVSVSSGIGASASFRGMTAGAYGAALDGNFLSTIVYSIGLAMLTGLLSVGIAFPFTWLIASMRRRTQTAWLVFLLSTLSLSEVLVVFAWQIMLSRRVGLSNLLVMVGILHHPQNYAPSFGAVLVCMVYLVLPFSILTLYPGISHLDPELTEAARTLGASPGRSLFGVVIPNLLRPIGSSFAIAMILSIGSYVTPLVLGRPAQWTASVLIANTALNDGNFHGAAAMSIVLLLATLVFLGLLLGVVGLGTRWLRRAS